MMRSGEVALRAGEVALRAVTAVGLVIDAVIHLHLASSQPPAPSGQLSQQFLFRAEGVVSVAVAVVLLVWATKWSYLAAVVVAGSAVAAVLLSRYVDIGSVGFVPDMYEPMWYASKVQATIAEIVALVTAAVGFLIVFGGRSTPSTVLARRHHAAAAS